MRKKLFLLIMLALCLAFSCSQQPSVPISDEAVSVYFAPDKNVYKPIIGLYGSAHSYIHLAIYSLTKDEIADALIQARNRGVEVKVLIDKTQAGLKSADDERLEKAGIEVRRSKGSGLMHNKFCIIDGKVAYTGSYNHTDNATFNNDENYVIFKSEKIAQTFEAQFQKLWDKHK